MFFISDKRIIRKNEDYIIQNRRQPQKSKMRENDW